MCDNVNTNINDYTDSDLYSLLSISAEISTKSLIEQQVNSLKQQLLDVSFHDFMNKVQERLIKNINKTCGFEDNVINYANEMKIPDGLKLMNTNNNKYYDRNIVDKVLIIDTKYRDNFVTETSTNFNIILPNVVKNVISIQLSDIEFPNTWFPFDEQKGNTFFHIKDSNKTEWIRIDVSSQAYYFQDLFDSVNNSLIDIPNSYSSDISDDIPDASYNSFEFIKSFLNIDFANAGGVASGNGTITFSSVDTYNKEDASGLDVPQYRYDNDGNQNNVPYINYDLDFFSDDPNKFIYSGNDYGRCSKYFGWNLGFRNIKQMYYSNKQTYTSESTIDLGGPRYLYLVIDDHNKYMNSTFIPFSKNMGYIKDTLNIFARVSLQGGTFSLYNTNTFSVYSDIRKYNGLIDLSHLTIKLIDEYGNPLNLNGNDFSFTIKISTVQTT
jgi:hypothetical protein